MRVVIVPKCFACWGALRFRAMLSCVSGDHTAKYRDALVAVTDTPGYERLAPFEKLLAFG